MSFVRIAAQSTRQLSTTATKASKGEVAEGYLKLKDVQARFQKNDGKPVHLKAGGGDAFLYYTTMTAAVVGVLGAGHLFWQIMWPKKDE